MLLAALRPTTMGFTTMAGTARCLVGGGVEVLLGGGPAGRGALSSSTFRQITTTTTCARPFRGINTSVKQLLRGHQNRVSSLGLLLGSTSSRRSSSTTTLAGSFRQARLVVGSRGSIIGTPTQRRLPMRHHDMTIHYSPLPIPRHVYMLGTVSHFSSFFGGTPPNPPRNRAMQGIGLLGAASVLLGKTKYVLAALKFTKLASLGSMVFTIGTYSMFFGLPYAVGMVGLIAVHEAGHAAVMHQRGIPFSPAVFIPFMGAVIATKQLPRDAWEDAVIAAGGPVLGSLGAGVVAVGAAATDSQLLYALADFGFMINLFNMMPIGSMDGGRIAGALSPYASLAGIGMGGLLAYQGVVQNPLFYLILLAGGYDTFMRFYDPHAMRPPNYYKITPAQRAVLTTGYFGLIVALLAAMSMNQRHQKPPEVLMREHADEKHWDMR